MHLGYFDATGVRQDGYISRSDRLNHQIPAIVDRQLRGAGVFGGNLEVLERGPVKGGHVRKGARVGVLWILGDVLIVLAALMIAVRGWLGQGLFGADSPYRTNLMFRSHPTILLGCWAEDIDKDSLEALRETAKADLVAGSLREAMMICRTSAGVQEISQEPDIVIGSPGVA